MEADDDFMTTYGIKGFSDGFRCFGDYTTISKAISGLDIPLDQDGKYYIYLWTEYNNCVYPDTLVITIEIKDGEAIIKDPEGKKLEEKQVVDKIEIDGENLSLKVGEKPSFTSKVLNNDGKYKIFETFMSLNRESTLTTDEESGSDEDGLVKDLLYFHELEVKIKSDVNLMFDETTKVFVNGTQREIVYVDGFGSGLKIGKESDVITPEGYIKPASLDYDFENEQSQAAEKIIVQDIKDGKVKYDDEDTQDAIQEALENEKEINIEVAVSETISKNRVMSYFQDENIVNAINNKIDGNQKLGAYYTVNIIVYVDGYFVGCITELETPITVTIPHPNGLPQVKDGAERVWKVIRYHDGVAEVLDSEKTENGICYKSNKFSELASVYEDINGEETEKEEKEEKDNTEDPQDTHDIQDTDSEEKTKETDNTSDVNNPKTGDTIIFYIVLGVVSVIVMIYLIVKRK